jgi:hypothetical protein
MRTGRALGALTVAATLTALVAAAPARPREGTVAIVSVEITGDGAPELREHLQGSLAGGLAAGGLRVIELKDVMAALSDTPELIGCRSTTCLRRIGEKIGAKYFVRTRVEATGSAYYIEIELLAAGVEGGLVTRAERSCPVCTIMEVNDLVSAAAKEMVELPPAKPVPVLIVTKPKGATVRVDEATVGLGPHQMNLDLGDHVVTATMDGYVTAEQTIHVREDAGEPQTFELVLAPAATIEGPETGAGVRPFRTWKWVTGGAAIATLGTGVVLIALDGGDACSKDPMQINCKDVYDTQTTGILSAVIGVALGGTSAWMFVRDKKDAERAASVSVTPTDGGAVGAVRFTF